MVEGSLELPPYDTDPDGTIALYYERYFVDEPRRLYEADNAASNKTSAINCPDRSCSLINPAPYALLDGVIDVRIITSWEVFRLDLYPKSQIQRNIRRNVHRFLTFIHKPLWPGDEVMTTIRRVLRAILVMNGWDDLTAHPVLFRDIISYQAIPDQV